MLYLEVGMQEPSICKSGDHLFLPVLEVYDPRCVACIAMFSLTTKP